LCRGVRRRAGSLRRSAELARRLASSARFAYTSKVDTGRRSGELPCTGASTGSATVSTAPSFLWPLADIHTIAGSLRGGRPAISVRTRQGDLRFRSMGNSVDEVALLFEALGPSGERGLCAEG